MRCLKRNQQLFYYYLYKGRVPVKDENGYLTGEYTVQYQRPVSCRANISAGSGGTEVDMFGVNVVYNRVLLIDDPKCPIDDTTLLCVDMQPKPYNPNETPAHDYVVKAVARSLNGVSIAIYKVNTNETND